MTYKIPCCFGSEHNEYRAIELFLQGVRTTANLAYSTIPNPCGIDQAVFDLFGSRCCLIRPPYCGTLAGSLCLDGIRRVVLLADCTFAFESLGLVNEGLTAVSLLPKTMILEAEHGKPSST
jgi:hypothetical protein